MTSAGTPWGEPRRDALVLDDYEVANLRAALRAIAGHRVDGSYDWDDKEWRSPLIALNTGDWVCQILYKLRPTDYAPNKTPEQARADARADAESAQAAAQGAQDEIHWTARGRLLKERDDAQALVARLTAAARMLLAEFKGDVTGEYSSPASREFEAILASLPSPEGHATETHDE